jgi:hypothetical protein
MQSYHGEALRRIIKKIALLRTTIGRERKKSLPAGMIGTVLQAKGEWYFVCGRLAEYHSKKTAIRN